ncbi:MAG: calcium-binding protein [Gammaproteobacteria bacterium]
MAAVTVPGPSGGWATIAGGSGAGGDLLKVLAGALVASASVPGAVQVTTWFGGTSPHAPLTTGVTNELLLQGAPGPGTATNVPGGYDYIANVEPGKNTISGSNTAILSGTSGGAFWVDGTSTVAASGGNNTVVGQSGGTYLLMTGDGNDALYSNGSATLAGGGGSNLLWAANSDPNLLISNGISDTIVAGAGPDTAAVYGTNALIFGGSGSLVVGAGNNATIAAGTGAETIFGGSSDVVFGDHSSGILFVGGAGSASIVGSDQSATTVFGSDGSNINFYSVGSLGAAMAAGAGNETLNAGLSDTNNTLAGGSGADTLIGGSGNDVLWAGVGGDTMTGGAGSNAFNFVDHHAGSNYVITDFTSNDVVNLIGYGANAATNALDSATTSGGSSVISLSDSTQITFLDVTKLNLSNFSST